ncbi:MAG: hypothetical protein RLZZ297_1784 [Chloroflexota bacterium]|jgi:septum site-determining protein MinC
MSEYISIKGARGGLRVHISDSCEWATATAALRQQLESGAALLQGMKLTLDLGQRELAPTELDALQQLMQGYQSLPVDIVAESRSVRTEARALGLSATAPIRVATPAAEPEATSSVVTRAVRSGQILRHHGDLVLLGDVNAGAEVIASGSVVVFGRVRGVVHAGALGNREAVICALELTPPQLRIADLRARAPEGPTNTLPEIAAIIDNQITVHAWHEYRR